ncbi:Protein argonaute-2 [Aphelenchoides besseyi]|nr:Protein argonaute-2 [Aphelenchoides besseyi]KAI6210759.1 Protein argonaute-2 [Aphelenchoides besseyi]
MSRQLNNQFGGMKVNNRGSGQRGRGNPNVQRGTGRNSNGPPRSAPLSTVYAPGTIIDGKSNAFEIEIQKGSVAYRYDVEIVKLGDGKRPDKVLTKQSDAGLRTLQKEACAQIVEAVKGLNKDYPPYFNYVYDGKSILFTIEKLPPLQNFLVEAKFLDKKTAMFVRDSTVSVSIMLNGEVPKIDYSELGDALVANVGEQADRSVRTFLEMATSQFICNTQEYQRVSAGTIFETHCTPLAVGMSLRVGVKKGVRVTDHGGSPKAYLFADMKRTAFFSTESLDEIYHKMVRNGNPRDRNQFAYFFCGVRMCIDYDPSRTFVFDCLSDKNINDPIYRVDGLSLPDFFQQRRQFQLKNVNLPGAHPKQPNGHKVLYPLEVIRPISGQLVPVEKLTDQAIRQLLLENSVNPNVRMSYVQQHVRQIAENEGGKFLATFGLKLLLDSNEIPIKIAELPKIDVGKNRIVQPQANGSWFREAIDSQFLIGTNKLSSWIIVHDRQVDPSQIRSFVRNLISTAGRSEMRLPKPKNYVQTDVRRMESVFENAKKQDVQFILYVDDLRVKSHGKLKLLEAYHKILTQHVVTKTLIGGPQTVKNVLMKMNVKCFGLNYMPVFGPNIQDLSPACQDLLIIGYDIMTPPSATATDLKHMKEHNCDWENKLPSVVGVCANRLANHGFAGDFFYQQTHKDLISSTDLKLAVERATQSACANGRRPTRVLVLRDGISEGRQQNVVQHELPAIRLGVIEGLKRTAENANVQPKITLIVATKEHFKRFFRGNSQQVSNTSPGDIISGKITRSDVPEFFAQAHHPLKGTPKIPQYAVLVNELEISSDKLESAMIHLSNMHQVSACPTSLPLPVYLADETAKRGMEIFKAFEAYHREGFLNEAKQNEAGIWNFKLFNEKFTYYGSPLYNTRFNA